MSNAMWHRISGNWKQFTGDIRSRWGKLTEDDIEQLAGERDKLIGKIEELYGITKEEARQQVEEWASNLQPE